MLKKYKIGIFVNKEEKYITVCNCGETEDFTRESDENSWRKFDSTRLNNHVCTCGNDRFISLIQKSRLVAPYIELIESNGKGFELKRTNLSVFYDDDFKVNLKENMVQILSYDLVNREIRLSKNGEQVDLESRPRKGRSTAISRFFVGIEDYEVQKMIEAPETKAYYDFIWKHLSRAPYGYHYSSKQMWRGLVKSMEESYSYLQVLSSAGFTNIDRFYTMYASRDAIRADGNNPREVLGLPKFVLRYVREDENIDIFRIEELQKLAKAIDGNSLKVIMEIVKDEGDIRDLCRASDHISDLIINFGYTNIKKLVLYLFRDVRMNQGIGSPDVSAGYLKDYVSMSTTMGLEYEKYPRSLKKEHDVVQMNYKVQEDEIKKKEFARIVSNDDYISMEYKDKEYMIIAPKEMGDLAREGSELSHCISSYATQIAKNKCKIYFLRKTDDVETPLVSIEVRNNNVRQARGSHNRRVLPEEKAFIKSWAEEMELQENYY